MILVTGATGTVGSEVVKQLLDSGETVRVLARNPQKAAQQLADPGRPGRPGRLEIAQGDLSDPGTLGPALAGVRKAFVLAVGLDDLAELEGNVFAAARAAGVEHVVKLSTSAIDLLPDGAISRWHRRSEDRLQASGLPYTVVRPGNFASNSLRWAPTIKAQGVVYAPHAAGQSVPIDPHDIAAVAVAALRGPVAAHRGKIYRLSGPEAYTPAEQVAVLAEVLGRPLRFVEVPEASARAGMQSAGLPAVLIDAVLELTRGLLTADGRTIEPTVQELLGRPPRTYRAWAEANRAAFL
jgi:uncharacterized protein YbjT (DUF2867 family)